MPQQPKPFSVSTNTGRPQVLVTVSGADKPGITSSLTQILAENGAKIRDIGQAVIHRLLSLFILFEITDEDAQSQTILKDLLFKANELGLKLEFQVLDAEKNDKASYVKGTHRYAVTLMGQFVTATALHHVTSALAKYSLNIDTIQRLSESEFNCVELLASTNQPIDSHKLRTDLLKIAKDERVDIALQNEGLFRRVKRLVVLDMDSTLIENEVIDEFARQKGVYSEVSALTHRAMNGALNFDESLRQRCEKLKGLTKQDIAEVVKRLKLTEGAKELIIVLRKLGYKTAIISGGFSVIADYFKEYLGIDYAYANQMEFIDNKFTGRIIPPVVNAQRKADLLDVISQQERIGLDQVIAIGDGANDLLMLEKAGLGIAFNAKQVVSDQAEFSLNQRNLRTILHLLGISSQDLKQVLDSL